MSGEEAENDNSVWLTTRRQQRDTAETRWHHCCHQSNYLRKGHSIMVIKTPDMTENNIKLNIADLKIICDFLPEEWVSLPGYCKVYENIHWLEWYKIQVVIKIISCLWLSHFLGCDGLMVRSHSMTETLPKWPMQINRLRPEQYGHHSADDIFKSIFLKKRWSRLYWKL